jgi:head-tail adaptor
VTAGDLRHRVTFQQRTPPLTGGVAQATWPARPGARMPANVESRPGEQEVMFAQGAQAQGRRVYTVTTRWRADVEIQDRVVYHRRDGDRVLEIVGVTNVDEDDRWLECACLEVRI